MTVQTFNDSLNIFSPGTPNTISASYKQKNETYRIISTQLYDFIISNITHNHVNLVNLIINWWQIGVRKKYYGGDTHHSKINYNLNLY